MSWTGSASTRWPKPKGARWPCWRLPRAPCCRLRRRRHRPDRLPGRVAWTHCAGAAWPSSATTGSACRSARRKATAGSCSRICDLAASARELSSWLTAADPTHAESRSAAEAALAMIEFAAGRRDWTSWPGWPAPPSGSCSSPGGGKPGTTFSARDWTRPGRRATAPPRRSSPISRVPWRSARTSWTTRRLLRHALTLREQIGDTDGASITRHNLQLLQLPDPPSPPRSRVPRRALHALGGVLGTLALVVAAVAITGALRSGVPAQGQPTGSPSRSATHATGSASSLGQPSSSSPSQPGQPASSSPSQPGQPSSSSPSQPGQPSSSSPSQPGQPSSSSPSQPGSHRAPAPH